MTKKSNPTRDEILATIEARLGGNACSEVEETKPTSPPPALFTKHEVDVTGKVEYKDIIGVPHPSGKEYWFTKYEVSDWDEEVRPLIPNVEDTHVFDHNYALSILMGIEYDKPVFAYGPPGSGKSVTPEQICARLNYPFMFVAGMGGTEPSDYVGSPWVSEGSMEWKDGPMSFAVRHGIFLLYDEPFKSSAQTNMCMQSLLDSRRTLKLYGHPDPVEGNLKAAAKFRIALADNVRGSGDQMDKFAAEIQDQSTLNRAAYKLQVGYLPAKNEVEILKKKYPEVTERLAGKVVQLAGMLRNAWDDGKIEMPYSVRDTQEFVEAALIHQCPALAFKQTYFDAVREESERKAIMDCWNTVGFDGIKLV